MPPSQLSELINAQIERLRPKLLDLTLRNPLLSTKFTDRSQAYIRIVDELPEVLAEQLLDSAMCFIPLPSLEDNPKDENTREFQNAWAQAQLEESYLSRLDNIDPDADDSLEKIALIEREMRDQIRHDLGLPPRQTRSNLSLEQHALNNHISPSYELPKPQGSSSNKQHYDSNMQTLFLPDAMERRLNSIYSKCRTWTQETGINVLQAAFGFLEWQDSPDSKIAYAPLLLLPVALEKKKTEEGYEFWLSATGEQLEFNTVLAEKFRLDFGIQLPELEEEEDVESYLAKIADISPKNFRWKVRRQVAVGVFPSTRLAMYKDLDTNGWDFTTHENIVKLLGGATASAASPFGDEYNVDDPNHESKVPLLVTQADSSQFSVLIDITSVRFIS